MFKALRTSELRGGTDALSSKDSEPCSMEGKAKGDESIEDMAKWKRGKDVSVTQQP